MFNLENNKQTLEQTGPNKFESMSDEEFFLWCSEHYNNFEKQNNLPYKTVVFKQGDRGLYSDDLKKIVLLDKFSDHGVTEINPQTPYIVEIIRDTKPDESRQGAILVKIIKQADLKDVYKNEEAKKELTQLEFQSSSKNNNELYAQEYNKKIFIHKKSDIEIKPKETWVGRCENKGSIDVFKPLLKAVDWQSFSVEIIKSTKSLYIYKNTYFGLQKKRSDFIYLTDENIDEVLSKFNGFDNQVLQEHFKREKKKQIEKIIKQQEYEDAFLQAKEWAWQEYSQNNTKLEKIGGENNDYYYKVKIGEAWHDVDFKIQEHDSDESVDWRKLVPEQVCRVMINEQEFLKNLKQFENIDINFEDIEASVPKKSFIIEKSNGLSDEYLAFKEFRKIGCEEVDIDLPYLRGKLVFEPRLICRYDVDSDYGLHKDDSSSAKTYRLAYALQSEKIDFADSINNLPEHLGLRVKQIVENYINSLLKPHENILEAEVANWIDDYDAKLQQIKKLDFFTRENILIAKTGHNEQKQILENRLLMSEQEFKDLQTKLPVEKFAKINDDHSLNYFGLPFKRYQRYENKHFRNSRVSAEEPVVGEYDNVFCKMTPQQLSFWLDSNQGYFNNLQQKIDIDNLADKLPSLSKTVDEEISYRCRLINIIKKSTGSKEYIYNINGHYLDLTVNLTDDFSDLQIVVDNIDSGMYGSLADVNDIYKFISEKKWFVSQQIINIFKTKGLDDGQLKLLQQKPGLVNLTPHQTLPFKPYI